MVNSFSTTVCGSLPQGLTLRESILDDATPLLNLGHTLLSETDHFIRCPDERADGVAGMQSIVTHYAMTPGWGMFHVWDGDTPVAEGVISTGQLRRTAHIGSLGVGVLRRYWGMGLGRALMAKLEEHAHAWHLDRLEFTVLAHNQRARDFYHRLGYIEDGLRIGSVRYESDTLAGNVHYADEVGMYKWIGSRLERPVEADHQSGEQE